MALLVGLIMLAVGVSMAISSTSSPFSGLAKFGAVLALEDGNYFRIYQFPSAPIQLYEHLEKEGGSDLRSLQFKGGWIGNFDPDKRELTLQRTVSHEELWTTIKRWLGLEPTGCG